MVNPSILLYGPGAAGGGQVRTPDPKKLVKPAALGLPNEPSSLAYQSRWRNPVVNLPGVIGVNSNWSSTILNEPAYGSFHIGDIR